jgi:hypothetical protein
LLIERKKTLKRRLQKLKKLEQKNNKNSPKQQETAICDFSSPLEYFVVCDAAPYFLPHRQKEPCKELCFAVERQTLKPFTAA